DQAGGYLGHPDVLLDVAAQRLGIDARRFSGELLELDASLPEELDPPVAADRGAIAGPRDIGGERAGRFRDGSEAQGELLERSAPGEAARDLEHVLLGDRHAGQCSAALAPGPNDPRPTPAP